MPRINSIDELQVGDVFYTTFVNNKGKIIMPEHPFIVIQTGQNVQVLDAQAIIAAFSMTNIHSKHGKELKEILTKAHYEQSKVIYKKETIIDISTFYLFNDRLSNNKKLEKLNVSHMFSDEKVEELMNAYIELSIDGKAKINKHNLKVAIITNKRNIKKKKESC